MYLAAEVLPGRETGTRSAVEAGLDALDPVYAFLYSRVGNRADAEELTQEVALKAIPRLREGAPPAAVRAYVFAAARSALAVFWSRRLRLPESELPEDVRAPDRPTDGIPSPGSAAEVDRILAALSPAHRRLLELRFLQGCSLSEVACEMGKTVGSVKVMQLRALRKAAALGLSRDPTI
jgi:RNA polymerase sigma factor (sigma-70 family)